MTKQDAETYTCSRFPMTLILYAVPFLSDKKRLRSDGERRAKASARVLRKRWSLSACATSRDAARRRGTAACRRRRRATARATVWSARRCAAKELRRCPGCVELEL